jgi:diadenylate cyclase
MRIDALVSRELIISIFNPSSPLHDGGIIIVGNRIVSAGSFFPLATDPDLERELGTRHRAAIGLSLETDALVIVVSEETGNISLAAGGEITRGLDATSLQNRLLDLLGIKRPKKNKPDRIGGIMEKEEGEKANT